MRLRAFGKLFFDDLHKPRHRPFLRPLLLERLHLSLTQTEDGFDLEQFTHQSFRPADTTTLLEIFQRIYQEVDTAARNPFVQALDDHICLLTLPSPFIS